MESLLLLVEFAWGKIVQRTYRKSSLPGVTGWSPSTVVPICIKVSRLVYRQTHGAWPERGPKNANKRAEPRREPNAPNAIQHQRELVYRESIDFTSNTELYQNTGQWLALIPHVHLIPRYNPQFNDVYLKECTENSRTVWFSQCYSSTGLRCPWRWMPLGDQVSVCGGRVSEETHTWGPYLAARIQQGAMQEISCFLTNSKFESKTGVEVQLCVPKHMWRPAST